MKELWVEKYRPKTLDEYVVREKKDRIQIETWIKERSIPHLLFSGGPGIGKTTLAKVLLKELKINSLDILELNASRINSVDDVRKIIVTFIETMPVGEFRVVLLDEADYLTHNAQAALRNVMEECVDYARFILTCNKPHKVMPALHSRCQGFNFKEVDKVEFEERIAKILLSEEVEFDLELLDTYVTATYPDLRKCINTIQQNVVNGKLTTPSVQDQDLGFKFSLVELFKSGQIRQARTEVCSKIIPDQMEDIYRWLYDNVNLISDDLSKQEKAILIIKQGLVDHAIIADPEINLSATLIRLAHVND